MKLPIDDGNDHESNSSYNDSSLKFNNLSNTKRMGFKKKKTKSDNFANEAEHDKIPLQQQKRKIASETVKD